MNQPVFLHIVERLEGFLGKLPEKIQKPVLTGADAAEGVVPEATSAAAGADRFAQTSVHEVAASLFAFETPADLRDVLMEVFRWQNITVGGTRHDRHPRRARR